MSKTAQSVFLFGIYMLGEGLVLLLFPNVLLQLVQLPTTSEVWIRLVGVALLALGYYYVRAGRANLTAFFPWTVQVRFAQFAVIVGLVVFGIGQPVILVFAGVEAASGLWTLSTLKT